MIAGLRGSRRRNQIAVITVALTVIAVFYMIETNRFNFKEIQRTGVLIDLRRDRYDEYREAGLAKDQGQYNIQKIKEYGGIKTTLDNPKSAKEIAEEEIEKVKLILQGGRGPFIVGGIGDSGTRGLWDVMMKFGIFMQGQDDVRGDSRDSKTFMTERRTYKSDGSILMRGPAGLYNEPIGRVKSINYNSTHIRPERWECGRQFIAGMIQQIANDTLRQKVARKHPVELYPFGFKHPRTALILPYFFATLGSQFAFVHVIRDGREVSSGDNLKIFEGQCQKYYSHHCNPAEAINMWADLNRDIFEYVLESGMSVDQYYAIRIEDLVSGDERCYKDFLKFLKVPPRHFNLTERLEQAITKSKSFVGSYFGKKYTDNERNSMLAVRSRSAKEALRFWGYNTTSFGLSDDCLSLRWRDELRRRKQAKLLMDYL